VVWRGTDRAHAFEHIQRGMLQQIPPLRTAVTTPAQVFQEDMAVVRAAREHAWATHLMEAAALLPTLAQVLLDVLRNLAVEDEDQRRVICESLCLTSAQGTRRSGPGQARGAYDTNGRGRWARRRDA
jgi:hypothetical protein